jgi:hypothetical protein
MGNNNRRGGQPDRGQDFRAECFKRSCDFSDAEVFDA